MGFAEVLGTGGWWGEGRGGSFDGLLGPGVCVGGAGVGISSFRLRNDVAGPESAALSLHPILKRDSGLEGLGRRMAGYAAFLLSLSSPNPAGWAPE